MIQDPQGKNRPVYTVSSDGKDVAIHLPRPDGGYEFEATYASVESVKELYPDAVKNVYRRSQPNKRRHPDVHFRATGQSAYCRKYLYSESTLEDDQTLNAKYTTDVARVTCKTCLKAILFIARRIA